MTKRKVNRKANPVAKDLRTPKYRMRVVMSKKLVFNRQTTKRETEKELNYGS
jgi:hypothetical protein